MDCKKRLNLFAVQQVFERLCSSPFNLYMDSAYVANSIPLLETVSYIRTTSTASHLFAKIQQLILTRTTPFFVGHLRVHTGLKGPLSESNAKADEATHLVCIALSIPLIKAQQAHTVHHLNASMLRQMFKISREQARLIVKNCPACVSLLPTPHLGVNSRGLLPNECRQMDVTHFPSFGRFKYIHVTIDTFSGFLFASPLLGEVSRDVISHVIQCMMPMGKPQIIKTDNGPGYTELC